MLMYYFNKYKRYIIALFISAIATVIFYGIYVQVCNSVDAPYEKDFKPISMKTLDEQLSKDKIDTIYFSTIDKNVFIILKNGELETIVNSNTDEFKNKLYESSAKVQPIEKLTFKSTIVGGRMLIYASLLACVYVLCIYYITKKPADKDDTDILIYNKRKQSLEKSKQRGTVSTSSDIEEEVLEEGVKTFNDIAGLREVKKDMKCLVDFLVNKEKYVSAGAKLPKGVILYGPPGTGKTLLAKAVASEADVPFLYMSGSEFIEMYVGVGAKRVRDLFEKARENAPCIIFIDEIDTIGSRRTDDDNGEDRKTINALLTEMDGFKESDNIIVIGATNRIEDLDSALLRPGRFTDKFCVPLPETADERLEVLNIYTKNKNLAEDVDLHRLAKETVGFSPAKLEALLNESAIIAVQNDRIYITKEDIDNAMVKLLLSGHVKEGQDKREQRELEIVAWHEAGHALVGKLFNKEVTKVTILASTSGAGGVTFSVPKVGLLSKEDIRHEIMQLYGGRIGELLYFNGDENKVTTGASNDIKEATNLIREYLTDYAMNSEIGMINLGNDSSAGSYLREHEVNMAKELEEETLNLLTGYGDKLSEIAEMLLEKETIYDKDLDEILF